MVAIPFLISSNSRFYTSQTQFFHCFMPYFEIKVLFYGVKFDTDIKNSALI